MPILTRLVLSIATAAMLAAPGYGQTAPAAKKAASTSSAIPRMPDGKPDFNGVWQGGSNRKGSWEEANSGFGVGGLGTDPTQAPGANPQAAGPVREPPPYKPEAAKRVLESYKNRAIDDPTAQCLPPGVPRNTVIGLFPMQFIQTPNQIAILYEYMNVFRIIPIGGKHPDDMEPTYMGDSVGHWEGDTLVVDVTGFNDKTWLIGTGTFHTEALHVTERFTRVDRDTITYDVVMEDPNVLTKPWEYHNTIMRREGTRVREYVCAENNLDPGRYEKILKEGTSFQRK